MIVQNQIPIRRLPHALSTRRINVRSMALQDRRASIRGRTIRTRRVHKRATRARAPADHDLVLLARRGKTIRRVTASA